MLRKILDLLKAARARLLGSKAESTPQTKSKKGKKTKKEDDSLEGLFNSLNIEEPGDNALGDEPPPQTTQTASGRKNVTYKLEDDGSDSAFEIWCFLQDLYDVRMFVKQSWMEYSRV